MTRQEFEAWAVAHGWTKDQWGHYHKGDRRFTLSKVAVRLEAKAGSAGWVRRCSESWPTWHSNEAGTLVGLSSSTVWSIRRGWAVMTSSVV